MFVMDYYGHKLSNGVLFAHHLILDVPGGSSHLGYRRRVPLGHYPTTRVNYLSVVAKQRSLSRRRRKTTVSQRESTVSTTNQQIMKDSHYINRWAVPEIRDG